MEKLELKHLCSYLPWSISFMANGHEYVLTADNLARREKTDTIKYIKPLLLPLSAITEQLEDGSVPIVELAKIAFGQIDVLGITQKDGLYAVKFTDEEDDTTVFSYNTNVCSFQADYMNMEELERRITIVPRQFQLFEYLYSKHFDIHNRIPAGLAIDKRTVKLTYGIYPNDGL